MDQSPTSVIDADLAWIKSLSGHPSRQRASVLDDEEASLRPPQSIIAVFELRPYWGPELQRQFEHTCIGVRECRSLTDLFPSVADIEPALLVIDLDADVEGCLKWLVSDAGSQTKNYPIIACGSTATLDLEWTIREMGVTAFLPDVIPGDDFARLCRRQLGLRR